MTGPCTARRATGDDLSVLVDMIRACTEELAQQRGGPMWSATESRTEPIDLLLDQQLGDPALIVVVGEFEGAVVGFAVCERRRATDARLYATITDLFTLPGARQVGVGESMMDLCVEWARSFGAFAIDAQVLPGTRDAKNFFERFGLTARKLTVSREL